MAHAYNIGLQGGGPYATGQVRDWIEFNPMNVLIANRPGKVNAMEISEKYRRLMHYTDLPERFRAGDFSITEEEETVLRGFLDSFYAAVEENGCVTLRDFTEFMSFLYVLHMADTEVVQLLMMDVFMESARIGNSLPPDPEAEAFEAQLMETEWMPVN